MSDGSDGDLWGTEKEESPVQKRKIICCCSLWMRGETWIEGQGVLNQRLLQEMAYQPVDLIAGTCRSGCLPPSDKAFYSKAVLSDTNEVRSK